MVGIDLLLIGVLGFAYPAIKKSRGGKKKVSSANNIVGILIALVVLCLDLQLAQPVFLTSSNLLNVLQQISTNFVIAIGMTFVIISGGIDLSVGSNIAVTGLLMAIMMKNWGVGVLPTLIVSLIFAGLIGLINGALIAFLNLPPFIATLGMMSIARGAAYTINRRRAHLHHALGLYRHFLARGEHTALHHSHHGGGIPAGLVLPALHARGPLYLRHRRQ